MALYEETREAGNAYREEILRQVKGVIRRERTRARRERVRRFQPDFASIDAYAESLVPLRHDYKTMLGWPLTEPRPADAPVCRTEEVATDELGTISRFWVNALPGLDTYGLYFQPPGPGPFPLVISQHGGGGTPELCSGFFGSANYNDMTRRVLRHGCAVFAPQLLLWREQDFGPANDRVQIDVQLKQLGGSITALEIYQIQRCLDYLVTRPEIDPDRIGMIGLSYGGFYTLYTAAAEPRIKVAVSSCFFNNRARYDKSDWTWFGAAPRFFDAEVAGLICPRPLFVDVGRRDTLFNWRSAKTEAKRVCAWYNTLGIGDRFQFSINDGGHELDKSPAPITFLASGMGV